MNNSGHRILDITIKILRLLQDLIATETAYRDTNDAGQKAINLIMGAILELETQQASDKRQFGSAQGQVSMAQDFDAGMELAQKRIQWEPQEKEPDYIWHSADGNFVARVKQTDDVNGKPWDWEIQYRMHIGTLAAGWAGDSDAAKTAVESWLIAHGMEYGLEI